MPPVFDTLSYARDMERAGFTREQAEGLANGQAKLIDDRLATKDDIAALSREMDDKRAALSIDIDDVRTTLSRDIENVRTMLSRDIEGVRTTLSRDIDDLRKEVRQSVKDLSADIKSSQRDNINKLGLLMVTLIGAATAILGLLSRLPH